MVDDLAIAKPFPPILPPILPLILTLILALLGAIPFGAKPVRAQDNDRVLLSTFCDAANIKGSTCKRAKGYPNAPKRGCDVSLTGGRTRGKFLASGNPLFVVPYESGCEAHTTDNGGVALFEEAGGRYVFKGFQPGLQGDCIAVAKDERQDRLVCLTGHMGQGILESGIALMSFTPGAANGIRMSLDMLLTSEDSNGAHGSNVVTCKERPPKYFELSKLATGPRKDTVTVEAGYADSETFRTACGKGFPKPADAIGDLVPGDAYVPEGHEKHGKFIIDIASRKVSPQN